MKNHCYNHYQFNVWIFILAAFVLSSCREQHINPDLFGTWKSKKHKITVRTYENEEYQFISDSTFIMLTINSDKTVVGKIGTAIIENGKITTNGLLGRKTSGVVYIIECNLIGKIFENDPQDIKEVQFWIYRQFENYDWWLRYTSGGSKFPMAHLSFSKVE